MNGQPIMAWIALVACSCTQEAIPDPTNVPAPPTALTHDQQLPSLDKAYLEQKANQVGFRIIHSETERGRWAPGVTITTLALARGVRTAFVVLYELDEPTKPAPAVASRIADGHLVNVSFPGHPAGAAGDVMATLQALGTWGQLNGDQLQTTLQQGGWHVHDPFQSELAHSGGVTITAIPVSQADMGDGTVLMMDFSRPQTAGSAVSNAQRVFLAGVVDTPSEGASLLRAFLAPD